MEVIKLKLKLKHNMQRWPHRIVIRKLENYLVFYVNLLLIVYLLYSIKVSVFHRSLVRFYLIINCVITVCRLHAALVRSPNRS